MEVDKWGKCSNCGKEVVPCVTVQDTSGYGDYAKLCKECLKEALELLNRFSNESINQLP